LAEKYVTTYFPIFQLEIDFQDPAEATAKASAGFSVSKAAWIGNAAVTAEGTERPSIESKARSVPYPLPFAPAALVTRRGI
jgi:hypothetical protein